MRFTRLTVPHGLLDLFIPIDKLYTGCMELLAVVLCFYTFRDLLVEAFWACYIDNDSVLASLLRGSATTNASDIN